MVSKQLYEIERKCNLLLDTSTKVSGQKLMKQKCENVISRSY